MGASIIEKHFTLDKTMNGPDHKASLEPKELKLMVVAIRNIEIALGSSKKKPSPSEIVNINIAIDDSDEENGCVYYYPGSHKDKVTYPIPDELKSEERMKTNPSQWSNERGKPIFVPGESDPSVISL